MMNTYPPSYYPNQHDEISSAVVNQPSFSGDRVRVARYYQNYPRGLEILNDLTTIVVREVLPLFWSCVNNKKYEILYQGTKIFSVQEDTDCWTHFLNGNRRPFKLNLYDLDENTIMSVSRPSVRLGTLVQVKIAGQIVGSVQHRWTWCKPKLLIRNANGVELFKIKRSICLPLCFWTEVDFLIYNMYDEEVGRITRHWSGSCIRVCASADIFSVKFPRCADIYEKALIIGACFLINFRDFEAQSGSVHDV